MATKWLDYMLIREITDPKYIQKWTAAIMHPVSLLLYTVFCASLPAEQMKVYLRMHVVPKNPSSAIHYVRYLLKYHILSYRIFWSWSIRWCAGIKMYLHKKTCFKLIKSDCKGIYNVTKIYISNKCWTSYPSKNHEKKSITVSTKNMKQHNPIHQRV